MVRLKHRLDALETGGAHDKWRVYAIPLFNDDSHDDAIAAYEAVHGTLEDGPKVLRVFLRQFCDRPTS